MPLCAILTHIIFIYTENFTLKQFMWREICLGQTTWSACILKRLSLPHIQALL